MTTPYRVACFLARHHGLDGLHHLLQSTKYTPICVFTHRYYPKSESSEKVERDEFKHYQELCNTHHIPLFTVDNKEDASQIEKRLQSFLPVDLLASISWRRIIPPSQLSLPRIGGVNLHRGKLPDYPGGEPIKQALAKNDKSITITAHELVEEVDAGPALNEYNHPVNYDHNDTLNQNIERLKIELTPHFGPLLMTSLDTLVTKRDYNNV